MTRCAQRIVLGALLLAGLLLPSEFVRDVRPLSSRTYPFPAREFARTDLVSARAFRTAMRFFNAHKSMIRNRNYLTIIDYTKPSTVKRMVVIDLRTLKLEKHFVAHGKNSGFVFATDFSNEMESYKSSRGFFLTGEEYLGEHGESLRLHGMQKGINDNALERGIVIHGADYAGPQSIRLNGGRLGRSLGCPAVPTLEASAIIAKIKNGSLLYIHAGPS